MCAFGRHTHLWIVYNKGNAIPLKGIMHVCIEVERRIYASVTKSIIGSDNGLSSGRRQAIILNNDGILLIGPLGTNFSEILIEILTTSLKKCVWKCRLRNGSHLSRPQCVDKLTLICDMSQKRWSLTAEWKHKAYEKHMELYILAQ